MEHANDNPPLDQRISLRSYRLHLQGRAGQAKVLKCFAQEVDQIVWLEEIRHYPPLTMESE